ncbi:uncharacterized protein LOC107762620 [Nicotiana tabacum]|uniref:Uncharacterized protein LOC107762620 n=2 Tax=Nicotiana tabacum TaxID=4097 RepID=A0AC58UH31_TOBAC
MVNHGERLASLEETVDRLRPIVETVPDQSNNLVQRLDDLDRRMRQAENDIANISRDSDEDRQTAAIETANIHGKFEDLQQERADDLAHQQHEADRLTAMQQTINDLTDKLNVVNAALQSLLREGNHHIRGAADLAPIPQKLKIPEPKPYDGSRDAKEVENFIFDIEQYFDAVGHLEESKKVATAAMYLQGDAKLWWRVKHEAIKAGEDTLQTWDELKVAIRLQFFPENVEYNSRRKLRDLRHTRSVREYVREFSALMLNIRDMGDKDKLFAFIEGLKPHARMELQRQRVDTLPKAIQAAECLGDYHLGTQNDRPQPSVRGGFNGHHPSNGGPSKSGGDRSASKTKTPPSNSNSAASINNNQGRKPPSECRHCGGAHWNNECPNIKVNAHQTVEDETDASDTSEDNQVGAFNAIVGSIPHALAGTSACPPKKKSVPITRKGKEKMDEGPPKQARTLMFVELKVNGKPLHALIDTGATHNYLSSTQVERLGLVVQKSKGRVKAINSPPQTLGGTTTNVPVKLGPYKGSIDLRIAIIDDFDIIVGLEFMRQTNTIPVPFANMLLMMGENGAKPCTIPCFPIKMAAENISAMQLEKVVNRHEPQVQATLRSNNQPSCHRPQKTGDAHHRVKTCQPCHKDKSDHSSQPGPSQPSHVPQRPWESVSLRFITGLPQVGNLASIMVVIDQFSDYATFIAAPQNISAEDTARLFFSHIVKHWGLPKHIVSRRDSRFTSNFWTHLFRCFGSTLSHNTDIHPPSDGQTDRFDDMLEEYLRNFATGSQKHWVKLLDAAQLCFNSQKSHHTNKSPFEIVTGQQPLLPQTVNASTMPKSPRAANFSSEWERNMEIVRSYLIRAQERAKRFTEQNLCFAQHQPGDKVMLCIPKRYLFAERTHDPRLQQKYIGPLPIEKRIGKSTYQVKTPSWWKIHPVFHVSRMKSLLRYNSKLKQQRGADLPSNNHHHHHHHKAPRTGQLRWGRMSWAAFQTCPMTPWPRPMAA